ncbi:hypothetical protein [Streptomyces sp. CA-111067]|uniref:hypothetical protein n=1 Tax=Streptomyces sp. CA-111067 TaxID=3240046 RepID=UPI003D967CEC
MSSSPKALRYLPGGLIIGAFWNRHRPPGEEPFPIVFAAAVQDRIKDSVGNAPLVVAIGLSLAAMLLGPAGDRHYFTRMAPSATADRLRRVRYPSGGWHVSA